MKAQMPELFGVPENKMIQNFKQIYPLYVGQRYLVGYGPVQSVINVALILLGFKMVKWRAS
jgi:hypothetical protein